MNDEEITTQDTTEEFHSDYAEALENTPVEVRELMWSEAFKLILKAIGDTYKLTDVQRDVLKRVVMETLVGTTTPVSRQIKLSDAGMTGELQDKILDAINDEIISRALNQIAKYDYLESEDEETDEGSEVKSHPSEVSNTPSTNNSFSGLQDRLSKPTTVAPIVRDYSVNRQSTPVPESTVSSRPTTMDIYREHPED